MKVTTKNIIVLTLSVLVLLLSFSNIVATTYGVQAETSIDSQEPEIMNSAQQQHTFIGEKRPVHLNIFTGNKLSPEKADQDEKYKVAQCPDGFVRYGFFGYGIAPVGRVESRLVGQWETSLKAPLHAGDQFKFNAWVRNDENVGDASLIFILKKNEEEIVRVETNDFGNQLSETPINIEATKVGSANLTPFQSGDNVILRIECVINGDGTEILYGDFAHNTGVTLNCDALNIVRVHGSKNGICAVYQDSFFISPSKMTFIGKVDEIIIDTQPQYDLTEDGFRETHWDYSLKSGTHTVEILMSYGGTDNTTMATFIGNIEIPKEEKLELFGIGLEIWLQIIGVIVLLIIIGVIVTVYRRRREDKLLKEYMKKSESTEL